MCCLFVVSVSLVQGSLVSKIKCLIIWGGVDIIIEIKCAVKVMCLTILKPSLSHPRPVKEMSSVKLIPCAKKVGDAGLEHMNESRAGIPRYRRMDLCYLTSKQTRTEAGICNVWLQWEKCLGVCQQSLCCLTRDEGVGFWCFCSPAVANSSKARGLLLQCRGWQAIARRPDPSQPLFR